MDANTPRKLQGDELEARAVRARWLALLFGGPVDDELVSCAPSAVCPEGADATEIEAERVRLFVNSPAGVPAPPYGSWWTEKTLWGASTAAVAGFLRAEGLEVAPEAGPPDALAAELEYVAFVLRHQRAALETGQAELEEAARRRESVFLREHLAPWLPSFREAARRATMHPAWLAALDALGAFVDEELRRTDEGARC